MPCYRHDDQFEYNALCTLCVGHLFSFFFLPMLSFLSIPPPFFKSNWRLVEEWILRFDEKRKELLTAACLKSENDNDILCEIQNDRFSYFIILFARTFLFTLGLDLFIVLTIIIMMMPFQNNRTRFITGEYAKPFDHYYSTEDIAPNEQTRITKKKHSRKICAKTHSLVGWRKKKTHIKIMLVDSLKMLISMSCDINAANAEHTGALLFTFTFFPLIFFSLFLTTFCVCVHSIQKQTFV